MTMMTTFGLKGSDGVASQCAGTDTQHFEYGAAVAFPSNKRELSRRGRQKLKFRE